MASKPYAATGKYIDRMSNYCQECRYRPDRRDGDDACPITTLYWEFLFRHQERLSSNPRMGLQLRNLNRFDAEDREKLLSRAGFVRESIRKEALL